MSLEPGGYSRSTIQGLVHGVVTVHKPDGDVVQVEVPSWAEIRSVVEHRGEVDQPAFHEVMDLERALEHLATRHPQAAAVAILRMWGFGHDELRMVLPEVKWRKLVNKTEAWINAYLTGADPEEAYRRTR